MSQINTELNLPNRNDPAWLFVTNLTNLNYDLAEIAQTGKSSYFEETISNLQDNLKQMEKLEPNIEDLQLQPQLARLKAIYKSDISPEEKFAKMNGILKNNIVNPIVHNRNWLPVRQQDINKLKEFFEPQEDVAYPETLKLIPQKHKYLEEDISRIPMNEKQDKPSGWHGKRQDPEVAIEVMKSYADKLDMFISKLDGYEAKTRQLIDLTKTDIEPETMSEIVSRVNQLASRMRTAQLLAVKIRNKIYRLEELPLKVKNRLITDPNTINKLYTYFMTDPSHVKERAQKYRDDELRQKLTQDFEQFLQQWMLFYKADAGQLGIQTTPALQLTRYGQQIKGIEYSYEKLNQTLDEIIAYLSEQLETLDNVFEEERSIAAAYVSEYGEEAGVPVSEMQKLISEFYELESKGDRSQLETVVDKLLNIFERAYRSWYNDHEYTTEKFIDDIEAVSKKGFLPLSYLDLDIYPFFVKVVDKMMSKKTGTKFRLEDKYDEDYIRNYLVFPGSDEIKKNIWEAYGYNESPIIKKKNEIIDEVERIIADITSAGSLNDKIVALNEAIHASHYNGQLAEYLGLNKEFLDSMSRKGELLPLHFKNMDEVHKMFPVHRCLRVTCNNCGAVQTCRCPTPHRIPVTVDSCPDCDGTNDKIVPGLDDIKIETSLKVNRLAQAALKKQAHYEDITFEHYENEEALQQELKDFYTLEVQRSSLEQRLKDLRFKGKSPSDKAKDLFNKVESNLDATSDRLLNIMKDLYQRWINDHLPTGFFNNFFGEESHEYNSEHEEGVIPLEEKYQGKILSILKPFLKEVKESFAKQYFQEEWPYLVDGNQITYLMAQMIEEKDNNISYEDAEEMAMNFEENPEPIEKLFGLKYQGIVDAVEKEFVDQFDPIDMFGDLKDLERATSPEYDELKRKLWMTIGYKQYIALHKDYLDVLHKAMVIEERLQNSTDELDGNNGKIANLHLAINAMHVYGMMLEHLGLDQEFLTELSHMNTEPIEKQMKRISKAYEDEYSNRYNYFIEKAIEKNIKELDGLPIDEFAIKYIAALVWIHNNAHSEKPSVGKADMANARFNDLLNRLLNIPKDKFLQYYNTGDSNEKYRITQLGRSILD